MTTRDLDEWDRLGRETSRIITQHHGLVLVSVGVSESADYATALRKFQSLDEQRDAVIAMFSLDGMFDIEYCDPQ